MRGLRGWEERVCRPPSSGHPVRGPQAAFWWPLRESWWGGRPWTKAEPQGSAGGRVWGSEELPGKEGFPGGCTSLGYPSPGFSKRSGGCRPLGRGGAEQLRWAGWAGGRSIGGATRSVVGAHPPSVAPTHLPSRPPELPHQRSRLEVWGCRPQPPVRCSTASPQACVPSSPRPQQAAPGVLSHLGRAGWRGDPWQAASACPWALPAGRSGHVSPARGLGTFGPPSPPVAEHPGLALLRPAW